MICDIVRHFPDLRLIACHFGGYHRLEEAEAERLGENVYLETPWPPTMAELTPERVRSIIDRHGVDRIVFGSDWPMADPAAEITAIRVLRVPRRDHRWHSRRQLRPAYGHRGRPACAESHRGRGGIR